MIQIRCPKCKRFFSSLERSGEQTCTECGTTFQIGRGK